MRLKSLLKQIILPKDPGRPSISFACNIFWTLTSFFFCCSICFSAISNSYPMPAGFLFWHGNCLLYCLHPSQLSSTLFFNSSMPSCSMYRTHISMLQWRRYSPIHAKIWKFDALSSSIGRLFSKMMVSGKLSLVTLFSEFILLCVFCVFWIEQNECRGFI